MNSFAPPFMTLNFDLMSLIFSFINCRPRLAVLSLVCKRWRQVILATLPQIPHRDKHTPVSADASLRYLLANCPALECLPEAQVPRDLWSSLSPLRKICTFKFDDMHDALGSSCISYVLSHTRLVTLSLRASQLSLMVDAGFSLRQFPFLVELSVLPKTSKYVSLDSSPSLKKLYVYDPRIGIEQCVMQLEELLYLPVPLAPAYKQVTSLFPTIVPQLKRLALNVSGQLTLQAATLLLQRCPALTALHIPSFVDIQPEAHTLLAPLFISCTHVDVPRALLLATRCKQLTLATGNIDLPGLCALPCAPHLFTSLATLYYSDPHETFQFAQLAPLVALEQLTLTFYSPTQHICIPSSFMLRSLKSLHLRFIHGASSEFSKFITPIVRQIVQHERTPFPSLTCTKFDVWSYREATSPDRVLEDHQQLFELVERLLDRDVSVVYYRVHSGLRWFYYEKRRERIWSKLSLEAD